MICPVRKDQQGNPLEPTEWELNTICLDPQRLTTIRRRLSDISWWMRLLCQPLAAMANREDDQLGRFQGRFRAVRICDEAALLAAYVDLNPIRAALAETLEGSDYTSVQRRIESLPHNGGRLRSLPAISFSRRSRSTKGEMPSGRLPVAPLLGGVAAGC